VPGGSRKPFDEHGQCGDPTRVEKVRVLGDNPRNSICGGIFAADSMPRSTIDFNTVRKIGLRLPGVEESTSYGFPALKVQGKLLACVPANPSAEPDSIVVRIDFDDRAELLAAAPDVYYLTNHYLDYSAVLVRLTRVNPELLRDLLGMAYKFVTANVVRRSRPRKLRKPGVRKH
jgi:hypothetical protein